MENIGDIGISGKYVDCLSTIWTAGVKTLNTADGARPGTEGPAGGT
jgi:hypothetical protein